MDGSRTGIADWPGSKLLFGSQQDRIGWVSDVSVRYRRAAGVGVSWVLTFWVPPESNIVPNRSETPKHWLFDFHNKFLGR